MDENTLIDDIILADGTSWERVEKLQRDLIETRTELESCVEERNHLKERVERLEDFQQRLLKRLSEAVVLIRHERMLCREETQRTNARLSMPVRGKCASCESAVLLSEGVQGAVPRPHSVRVLPAANSVQVEFLSRDYDKMKRWLQTTGLDTNTDGLPTLPLDLARAQKFEEIRKSNSGVELADFPLPAPELEPHRSSAAATVPPCDAANQQQRPVQSSESVCAASTSCLTAKLAQSPVFANVHPAPKRPLDKENPAAQENANDENENRKVSCRANNEASARNVQSSSKQRPPPSPNERSKPGRFWQRTASTTEQSTSSAGILGKFKIPKKDDNMPEKHTASDGKLMSSKDCGNRNTKRSRSRSRPRSRSRSRDRDRIRRQARYTDSDSKSRDRIDSRRAQDSRKSKDGSRDVKSKGGRGRRPVSPPPPRMMTRSRAAENRPQDEPSRSQRSRRRFQSPPRSPLTPKNITTATRAKRARTPSPPPTLTKQRPVMNKEAESLAVESSPCMEHDATTSSACMNSEWFEERILQAAEQCLVSPGQVSVLTDQTPRPSSSAQLRSPAVASAVKQLRFDEHSVGAADIPHTRAPPTLSVPSAAASSRQLERNASAHTNIVQKTPIKEDSALVQGCSPNTAVRSMVQLNSESLLSPMRCKSAESQADTLKTPDASESKQSIFELERVNLTNEDFASSNSSSSSESNVTQQPTDFACLMATEPEDQQQASRRARWLLGLQMAGYNSRASLTPSRSSGTGLARLNDYVAGKR